MENTLTGTTDIYTVCTNESILTIDDKEVGENIKPFIARCKITGQPCTVQPIPTGDIIASLGLSPSAGLGDNIWLNYAQPFGDIDERVLTEGSFFLCAIGMTKVEISDPAQYNVRVGEGYKIYEGLSFPFETPPLNDPLGGYRSPAYADYDYNNTGDFGNPATFGANRSSKGVVNRSHAGVDLYYDVGEPIYAMADGKVISKPSLFYAGTYVIEIEHDYEVVPGHKIVIRYGEVDPNSILVQDGQTIEAGQQIASIGLLVDRDGNPAVRQPYPDPRGMLHLEMYDGTGSGSFGNGSLTGPNGHSFYRRDDLIDPTPFVQDALKYSFGLDCERIHGIDRLKRINDVESSGELIAVDGATISCPNTLFLPPPIVPGSPS